MLFLLISLSRLDYRTTTWDPAFQSYLKKLSEELPVLLTGDLNVAHLDLDVHDPKANVCLIPCFESDVS
jgi:exonuclease III